MGCSLWSVPSWRTRPSLTSSDPGQPCSGLWRRTLTCVSISPVTILVQIATTSHTSRLPLTPSSVHPTEARAKLSHKTHTGLGHGRLHWLPSRTQPLHPSKRNLLKSPPCSHPQALTPSSSGPCSFPGGALQPHTHADRLTRPSLPLALSVTMPWGDVPRPPVCPSPRDGLSGSPELFRRIS